jgi:hypothetical protein
MLRGGGRPGSSGCELRPGVAATEGGNSTSDRARHEVRSGWAHFGSTAGPCSDGTRAAVMEPGSRSRSVVGAGLQRRWRRLWWRGKENRSNRGLSTRRRRGRRGRFGCPLELVPE